MSEKFFGDVVYEVWRSGGNPDAVGRERVESAEYGGAIAEEVAGLELRLQRARAAVERDMREWEANEWDLPADERFCQ
jgi:hypothetical protein